MKGKIKFLCLLSGFLFLFNFVSGQYDQYIWETYRSDNIDSSAQELIDELRLQIDKILSAGHLAPARYYFADLDCCDGYYQYWEPGRIILTLAMAYPYLTTEQKNNVKTYVNQELSNSAWTPWASNDYLNPSEGARREYYSMSTPYQWNTFYSRDLQSRLPTRIAMLYGLWLYAYNSGDWAPVTNNWSSIKSFYTSRSGSGNIYGTMCAHVAMARMAYHENDSAMQTTAVNNAVNVFNSGLNFTTIENNSKTYYNSLYDSRRAWGVHQGQMFLNLVPEVGRYLKNADANLRTAVVNRNNEGKTKFSKWYVGGSRIFCRWTGDEGVGAPTELIGMIFPVERWVVSASKETLTSYMMRSASLVAGDCYVIEALIHTISSYGTDTWVDVRSGSADTTPPSAITDLAIINRSSSTVTLRWTSPGDDGKTGTAYEYDIRYALNLITESNFASAVQCSGEPLPQVSGTIQSFVVGGLLSGTTYYFAMKTADEAGNVSGVSNCVSGVTQGTGPSESITIITPNGGQSWTVGTVQTVTWTWTGIVGPINIDLSTNGGSSWTNLVSNTQNDGSQTITVPDTPSTACRIKISETDGTPSDISDNNFSIVENQGLSISVSTGVLVFGEVEIGKTETLEFVITNTGNGLVTGIITGQDEWVEVNPKQFALNSGYYVNIMVTVDNGILSMREGEYRSKVVIESTAGNFEVEVVLTATCILPKPNPYDPDLSSLEFFGNGLVPGKTKLKIFTVSGEFVRELILNEDEKKIIWDGKDISGNRVIKGIYIYIYETPKEKGAGKFLVK